MIRVKLIYIISILYFIIIIFTSANVYAISQNSFLSNKKIAATEIYSKNFSSSFQEKYLKTKRYKKGKKFYTNTYNQIQSFCVDGSFFYVACVTNRNENYDELEKRYIYQETTILKIRIKDKKIVASAYLGRIGHSNSLAYNHLNNTLLIAPCNKTRRT